MASILSRPQCVNSSRPGGALCPSLVQVLSCPSYYMNQCVMIIDEVFTKEQFHRKCSRYQSPKSPRLMLFLCSLFDSKWTISYLISYLILSIMWWKIQRSRYMFLEYILRGVCLRCIRSSQLSYLLYVTLVFFRYPFSIFGCNFPMSFHHHSVSFAYVMWIQRKGHPACGWLVQVSWYLVWCGGCTPLW